MIRAIIWDLGGVLVRTTDPSPRAALAARLGMTVEAVENMVFDEDWGKKAEVGIISARERWERVGKHLNLTPDELTAFEQQFWGGDSVDYNLIDHIQSLRHTYRTALLSNADDALRSKINDDWHIASVFDKIIISAEVGLAKPDPRIYQLALEYLDIAPSEAIFIDDFEKNVVGARAIGLHAIHFKSPVQAQAELDTLINNG